MEKNKQLSQERILIVRLSAIGDVIMSTVVAANLKKHFHGCHITWLVSPPAADILRDNPNVDRLLVWDRRPLDDAFAGFNWRVVWRELKNVKEIFRPYDFDIAIDLQNLFLTGLISYLSGAPRRIGIHDRHEGGSLFMTETADKIENPHKICRYMTALSRFGIYEFQPTPVINVTPEMRKEAKRFWVAHGISREKPILMVSVCTSIANKNWPAANFATALLSVPAEVQIIFCGLKQHIPLIKKIQRQVQDTKCIAGETTIGELAGLFADADLLLTGDSGPLHLAEAVGLGTISLWGPTRPEIFAPLTPGHEIIVSRGPCVGCQKTKCKRKKQTCMQAISPEIVGKKLRKFFAEE